MDNITQEQILALGLIGFSILGFALLATLLVMAGTLKLSIGWLGNRSPSFLACLGWLLAISFVNCFIVFGTMVTLGEGATLLVTPLTWFVTLYMVSVAADCGLFRAFGIWIVNSILSTVGLVAIMFVAAIPLAMIGAGANVAGENLQAEIEKVEQMMAESERKLDELDSVEFPEISEVKFEPQKRDDPPTLAETVDPPRRDRKPDRLESAQSRGPSSSAESGFPSRPKAAVPSTPKAKPRRAQDGSTINPFFQN